MQATIPIFPVRERKDLKNGDTVYIIRPLHDSLKRGVVSSSTREYPTKIYVEYKGVIEHDEHELDSPFLLKPSEVIWFRKIIQRYKDVSSRIDKDPSKYLQHIINSARSGNTEAIIWMYWLRHLQYKIEFESGIHPKAVDFTTEKILNWIQSKEL